MVRSKKEGKIKTKKIVKKAIVSSVSQTWSKYIKNKKEKAMITKLVKKIENKDRFVSSKKKKFEKEWKEQGGKKETEDYGKIKKVKRIDW
ncbi:MAG: hypothetical protein HOD60_12530 [Candidatus Nitrosopelagicus sp.]|jgi:hypothetical protein|nr:hypothetical protein [Candidatus Nitrosopelagicus sp.]